MTKVSIWTRAFVAFVFIFLGLAFLAETLSAIYEYREAGRWFTVITLDSQNFIFFPTAGIAVLMAFYRPACVAVDSYGRGLVFLGRFILPLGLVGCGVLAWLLAGVLGGGENRSLFEIAPGQLAADTGTPGQPGPTVLNEQGERVTTWSVPPRAPVMQALAEVRMQSTSGGLLPFSDTCQTGTAQFVEVTVEEKYCFVAGERLSVRQCCEAKGRFREAINVLHAREASLTGKVHRVVMPVKIYFLLILVGIGVMLVRRRKAMRQHYYETMNEFSVALPIGAGLMVLWPLLNTAYTLSYDVVFGDAGGGAYRASADLYSLAFAAWALMILFYHMRSYPSQFEMIAKVGGLVGAGLGVLQYEHLVDYLNRSLGIGANMVSLAVWLVAMVFLVYLFSSRGEEEDGTEDDEVNRRASKAALEAIGDSM